MTNRRRFLLAVAPALALGCTGKRKFNSDELAQARAALETCLDAWKRGEMPETLKKRPEPILFAEEGPAHGLKLVSYEILDSRHTDHEAMRFSVKLSLQDKRGKAEERQATFAVGLGTPIAVGRDPFF